MVRGQYAGSAFRGVGGKLPRMVREARIFVYPIAQPMEPPCGRLQMWERRFKMGLIILIVVLVLIFGGGGGYYGYSRWGFAGGGGIGLGTILLILLLLYFLGVFH